MTNSVFRRLYNLLDLASRGVAEDFLTELVSELFKNPDFVGEYFRRFVGVSICPEQVSVQTQVTYPKLTGHQTDSRPDMVVQFSDSSGTHIAFFEHKLDASEGDHQLERYADHLDKHRAEGKNTYLFYVTKYYDPKPHKSDEIRSLRWFEVYELLKQLSIHDTYRDKVTDYMEEIGLNDTRQFSPLDMYVIQEMDRLQRMMDECMDGPVDELVTELFGVALQQYNRYNQMKYMGRYFKASVQQDYATEIGVGFYSSEGDYPIVSVVFEVNRRCEDKSHVIDCMKEFVKIHSEWETFDLDTNNEWVGISRDKYLSEFLTYDDHIAEIQSFFLDNLRTLHGLKQAFPSLHWK